MMNGGESDMIMTLLITFFLGFGFGSAYYLFQIVIGERLVRFIQLETIRLLSNEYLNTHCTQDK